MNVNSEFMANDLLKFAITLLSIINPLGAIPVFLGYVKNNRKINIKKVSKNTAIASSITLILSLFLGQSLLKFFGISIASFTIGGGLLLFTMAFSMISAHQSNTQMNTEERETLDFEREISIIPLAIPLLSGPGAISTSIIYAKNFTHPLHWFGAIVMILIIGLIIKLTLQYSEFIGDKLGQLGLNVMTRIEGLILLSMSIEMIVSGVKDMMPILKAAF